MAGWSSRVGNVYQRPPTMPDRRDARDRLAGLGLAALGFLVLACAILAVVYFAMVGMAECAAPWTGCATPLGLVQ